MASTSTVRRCPLCGFFSPSLTLHVSHFRLVHSKDANFCVVCGIDGCGQEFRAFSAYNSHVYRRHRAAVGVNELWSIQDPEPETTPEIQPPTATLNLQSEDIPLECSEPCEELRARTVENPQPTDFSGLPSDYGVQCRRSNAEFLMTLSEGRQLSQQAISDVIVGCRKICQQTVCTVIERSVRAIMDADIDVSTTPGLENALLTVPDPFEGIDTPYLREKFYLEHMNYVVRKYNNIIIACVRMNG